MQVVTAQLIKDKKVLLRLDLDVPIVNGKIKEEFRLMAAMPTLELCLLNAQSVVICGHVGRPGGKEDPDLSVAPIVQFLEEWYCDLELPPERLHVLENLRFEVGEELCDPDFARELAGYGDFFINEAFAAHHPAASTTLVPRYLPSAAGLRFNLEVNTLMALRMNPKKPLVAIIGGVKIEDKYPAIVEISKFADAVLVGGLLADSIRQSNLPVSGNVILAKRSQNGLDISDETIQAFIDVIKHAKQVIWVGPVGKYEERGGVAGNIALAEAILASKAESVVGGGDTLTALDKYLEQFSFVSTGGGATLELLTKGYLPTIQALNQTTNIPQVFHSP